MNELYNKNLIENSKKLRKEMTPEDRGAILGVMDAQIAAKLTKIMEPDT